MMILILTGVLVGAMLGLRLKVFVLVPVICGALAIVVVDGIATRGRTLAARVINDHDNHSSAARVLPRERDPVCHDVRPQSGQSFIADFGPDVW